MPNWLNENADLPTKNHNMPLCSSCDALDLTKSETLLGPYKSILSKANSLDSLCEGCLFFIRILHSSGSWGNRIKELEGKDVWLSSTRLDVRDPESSSRTYSSDDLRFDICAAEDYDGEFSEEKYDEDGFLRDVPVDRTKEVVVNSGDEKCLDNIMQWMQECSEKHGGACLPRADVEVRLPERIIKVSSDANVAPRIVETRGDSGSYLALSAYSGDETAKLSFEDFTQNVESAAESFERILDMKSLPKTFVDAIAITRYLKYEYIYIAPLCHPSNTQPSDLLSIFGHASLLLSASASMSFTDGIFKNRNIYVSPALGRNKDRYLRQHYLRIKEGINDSLLGSRGWAFIERAAAPRAVHFTKRQLLWECPSTWNFEAAHRMDKRYGSGQIRGEYQKALMQPFINMYFDDKTKRAGMIEVTGDESVQSRYAQALEVWYQFIDKFNGMAFSNPADKLLALSCFVPIFDDGSLGEYIGGIWSKNMEFGILWGRPFRLLTPAPSYRAPSWSWLAVDGAISSMWSHYSRTLLQEELDDPSWSGKYVPKLISHHIQYAEPGDKYSAMKQGSHIIVEGSIAPLLPLVAYLREKVSNLTPVLGLDQSNIFDCSCCVPRPEESQQAEEKEFEARKDHYYAMVVQGDIWQKKESSSVSLVVLRKVGDEGSGVTDAAEVDTTFEKVGVLHLSQWYFGAEEELDIKPLNDGFDGADWERRTIKLI
ncbi:hypothetical protein ACMFMG_004252 [Clarireedia jacksonii]